MEPSSSLACAINILVMQITVEVIQQMLARYTSVLCHHRKDLFA